MNYNNNPIGVFDSGLGGISVLKELHALMPNENFIYYGDSKNAPYGTKSDDEIMKLSYGCVGILTNMDVKAVVIACNTATSVAANVMRCESSLPIIGIEPAVKPAALKHPGGKILVMATPVTLKNDKFLNLTSLYKDMAEIIPLPCPGLVEIIEQGNDNSDEIADYLKNLFKPYNDTKIDAVVLGCTHYPHIRKEIKAAFAYAVDVIDGATGTAKETQRRLAEINMLAHPDNIGTISFISSMESKDEIQLMKNFFEK